MSAMDDITTDFESLFPLEDISMDIGRDMPWADDELCLDALHLSYNSLTTDLGGLKETASTTKAQVVQDRRANHTNQDMFRSPFDLSGGLTPEGQDFIMDEAGNPSYGIMSDYDGVPSFAASSSVSGDSAECGSYYLSPSSLISQLDSTSPANPIVAVDRDMTHQHQVSTCICTTTTKVRKILPRPANQTIINKTMDLPPSTKKLQTARQKKTRPCDLRKEAIKTTKPEACHLCPERRPSKRDLERHFVVSHKEYATSIGLKMGPFYCPVSGCAKKYTRVDYVTRHMTDKHGRTKLKR